MNEKTIPRRLNSDLKPQMLNALTLAGIIYLDGILKRKAFLRSFMWTAEAPAADTPYQQHPHEILGKMKEMKGRRGQRDALH